MLFKLNCLLYKYLGKEILFCAKGEGRHFYTSNDCSLKTAIHYLKKPGYRIYFKWW